MKTTPILAALVIAALPLWPQSDYLPLVEGNRWTLKSNAVKQELVISVVERQDSAYRIQFASPFGSNEWMLEPRGDRYLMTKYATSGEFMDLPPDTVYFDFGAGEGHRWNNVLGKMRILRRQGSRVLIEQASEGGKMVFGFEPGKGFVQFGEGRSAFHLSEPDSVIRTAGTAANPAAGSPADPGRAEANDHEPVSHVPVGAAPGGGDAARRGIVRSRAGRSPAGPDEVLFSITPNIFANEPQTPQNLLKRFEMTADAGIAFLAHNAKWSELEPNRGQYSLDGLNFNVETAKRLDIPMAYTFRLIETVDRAMPGDLQRLKWTDPQLEERLMQALDTIVPRFEGRVRWFMLGNEIDGYFARHPDEIEDFALLFHAVKRRIQQLDPSIQVSSSLMFGGVRALGAALQPLNEQFDFLCFTYYPIRGDFTMKDPGIVGNDLGIMRTYAQGRKVILQEVGYPSGELNQSNEEKQAEFVRNIFRELRANNDLVEAACFWLLADLKDEFVQELSSFYGVNASVFHSFLQTLGMHDRNGRPKAAWGVYRSEFRR